MRSDLTIISTFFQQENTALPPVSVVEREYVTRDGFARGASQLSLVASASCNSTSPTFSSVGRRNYRRVSTSLSRPQQCLRGIKRRAVHISTASATATDEAKNMVPNHWVQGVKGTFSPGNPLLRTNLSLFLATSK